jgi:hypothetical protein
VAEKRIRNRTRDLAGLKSPAKALNTIADGKSNAEIILGITLRKNACRMDWSGSKIWGDESELALFWRPRSGDQP